MERSSLLQTFQKIQNIPIQMDDYIKQSYIVNLPVIVYWFLPIFLQPWLVLLGLATFKQPKVFPL